MSRRWLDLKRPPTSARSIMRLLTRSGKSRWPQAESADELHDILLQLGFITALEGHTGQPHQFGRETPHAERVEIGDSESGWENILPNS